ncbi:MAG: cupin domain-containing protein [Geminicoccaceae bacterium]
MTPAWLIDHLGMKPHPEGGHYVETFRDVPESGGRGALTCIHFLLQVDEVSAWHRIDAAEIWHFAAGDPLVLTLSANGHDAEAMYLGPDVAAGQRPHVVVPPDCWQTAETLGSWTLVSCIVAPAFDFDGFELAPPDWRPKPRAAGRAPGPSMPDSSVKGSS